MTINYFEGLVTMPATKEELAPIIIETLKLPIEGAAKKIKEEGKLEFVTEQDIMDSIKHFRSARKGLEMCCDTILAINRRKNLTDNKLDIGEEIDLTGLLSGTPWTFPKQWTP